MENNPAPAAPQADPAPQAASVAPAGAGKTVDKNLHVWLWCFLLGGLGIDRFMRGQIGLGVVKLLTAGGFGIWAFIDWVIALSKAYGASFKDAKDFTFSDSGTYTC